ncbi:NADH-quinone oxidoreductase subunit N [Egibacter rhizosphaerae]|uniref:NADH-quinone oxidoreductase subunit N n=1 Tax=Egibacter rhizosphaerae TaxID=1670831 RepID=A0A411YGK0_9ACTN|nr:NADH-quinone oxidoreductase subunit N [Egibacter rhizosphaerae]QBI20370.1 NADH-quinone oxidoreductase subunit N [Egibacter rhizosphaerae]
MIQATLAQVAPQIPEIPWGALSPELVLFGAGIIVLLLETAGETRVRVGSLGFVLTVAAAATWFVLTEQIVGPSLLAVAALVVLGLTVLFRLRPRVLSAVLSALGLTATLGVIAWQWIVTSAEGRLLGSELQPEQVLADTIAVDGIALFTRITVCLAALIAIPLGYQYLEDRRMHRGEYYPLLIFAAVGMNLLASAQDLIMVFISIEILSLALYIMTGFAKRDLRSQEGAFKYFLLGAFSSAILLYGIALAYGVAGSTNVAAVGAAMSAADAPTGLTLAALAFLIVGLAFKTALVPFHMWTPDVYQGAPTPVTGFMAAATKAAAFAAFLRLFSGAFAGLEWSWVPVLWTLAALTMIVGAVLAVVQDDVKRMLAYSAVAHAGYALIGIVAVNRDGVSGVLFYLLAYAIMSLGAFGVLAMLEQRQRKAISIADLRGFGKRYPVPAGMLALFLLSLAGIPGTAGFMGKLAVFRAGVAGGQWTLVVIGVVSSVIAAYFYVRVIRAMFMEDEPEELAELPLQTTLGTTTALTATSAAVVVLGILPTVLVDVAGQATLIAGIG